VRNGNLLAELIRSFFEFSVDVSANKVNCHGIIRAGDNLVTRQVGIVNVE